MNLWAWIKSVWAAWMNPVDVWPDDEDSFPDSSGWADRIPSDADCPDTEPTAPGALDHDV